MCVRVKWRTRIICALIRGDQRCEAPRESEVVNDFARRSKPWRDGQQSGVKNGYNGREGRAYMVLLLPLELCTLHQIGDG